MNKFQVGDTVEWTSGGRTKRGQVVLIVPAGEIARHVLVAVPFHDPRRQEWHRLDSSASHWRDHESYIVAVPSRTGRGKLRLYWPRVWHLEKAQNEVKP